MTEQVTKLTANTFKVVKTIEETHDYTMLKRRREYLSLELAKIDAQLALGDSVGVVEKVAPVRPERPVEVVKG